MVCVRVNLGPTSGPEAAQSMDRPALRPPRTFDSLPLWRVVRLAGGTQGSLVWAPSGDERPARLRPFVVLGFAASLVRGMKKCANLLFFRGFAT